MNRVIKVQTGESFSAETWRLLQAEELLLRYEKANGCPARTIEELEAWVTQANLENPIVVSDEARNRYEQQQNPNN